MNWRDMHESDLRAVLDIATQVHPDYPERLEIFADKLAACPRGCRLLVDTHGHAVGYGFAHPWRLGRVPALDCQLGPLPAPAECLHIHDVAVLPHHRGGGQPARFIAHLRGLAAGLGLHRLSLVAVKGLTAYWARQGFAVQEDGPHGLSTYGKGATYMIASI